MTYMCVMHIYKWSFTNKDFHLLVSAHPEFFLSVCTFWPLFLQVYLFVDFHIKELSMT